MRIDGRFAVAPNGAGPADHHAPAGRPVLLHHAVELPDGDGHAQDRPGDRRRLHDGGQAGQADAAVDARAGRRSSRRPGCPAACSTSSPRSRRRDVSKPMIADPRLRKLSFTGSTEVGKKLDRAGAPSACCDVSMELGGNAPFLVFDDADVDAAVEGALIAKMRNIGEACTAANRFHVAESVADEFTDKLAERLGAMKVGRGTEDGRRGRPADRRRPARQGRRAGRGRRRQGRRGARAAARSATARATSTTRPCSPACPDDARLLKEEIFGPVAPVIAFDDEDEAIAAANDTEYGLVAYVYTPDLKRAFRVCEGLDTGMVGLNQGIVSNAGGAVRRRQAVGLRPRGRPRGHRRVPRDQVRGDGAVGVDPLELVAQWYGEAVEPPASPSPTPRRSRRRRRTAARRCASCCSRASTTDGVRVFTNYEGARAASWPRTRARRSRSTGSRSSARCGWRGRCDGVEAADSDAYYASRGRGAPARRLGARAQGRVIPSREWLLERAWPRRPSGSRTEAVARPPYWGGYRLVPDAVELWSGPPVAAARPASLLRAAGRQLAPGVPPGALNGLVTTAGAGLMYGRDMTRRLNPLHLRSATNARAAMGSTVGVRGRAHPLAPSASPGMSQDPAEADLVMPRATARGSATAWC